MPIRGIGETLESGRWVASARFIDDIAERRAQQRYTLTYRFTERLRLGVEWNPLADDVGLIGNYVAVEETANRPALLLGTSSDRIGTATGRVYYATLSKNLDGWIGVPVAPYVGASWSDRSNRWEELAGLQYRLFDGAVSFTHLWDGVNLHHTVDWGGLGEALEIEALQSATLGLIVAEQDGEHFVGVLLGGVF